MDRTFHVPSHRGPLVLPNSPFLCRLLRHARRDRIAIRDVIAGVQKTYGDLLADALALRALMEDSLSQEVRQKLDQQEEDVFVGVLSAGGYEFAVAVVAVLALGAAIVPMSVEVSLDEAEHYVTTSNQILLLSSAQATPLASEIVDRINQNYRKNLRHIAVLPNLPPRPICTPLDMVVSSNLLLDERRAGVIIFTSGTTGKPKGAVHRRSYTYHTAEAIGEGYDIDHNDVLLHVLPVHHTAGLGTSFFPWLNAGACIEFRSGTFNAQWIWNRWLEGGITVFSGVPTIYMRLKWFFEQHISNRPEEERQNYLAAANQLRVLKCGSSALQKDVQTFWTSLRNGQPILTRYGATEFPGCIKVPSGIDPSTLPADCVGMVVPGVEVKLSDGESGELLVRSPYMFSRYLNDDDATARAHNADGYFKTGDIGRLEGHLYFITGRASVDIIKSGGYKISAIEIERAILELPYVREVAVVGVADEEYGQRVGAVLVLKSTEKSNSGPFSLEQLRQDLGDKLARYKLPTLLRLLDGEIPKGATGKVQKKVLCDTLFPSPGWEKDPHVLGKRNKLAKIPTAKL